MIELDGDAIGIAGASAHGNCDVEIYYALLPAGRGRSVATQAARLLADWATGAGAPRVVLVTFPENTASRSTASRAGFVVTGRERREGAEGDREVEVWEYDDVSASTRDTRGVDHQPRRSASVRSPRTNAATWTSKGTLELAKSADRSRATSSPPPPRLPLQK